VKLSFLIDKVLYKLSTIVFLLANMHVTIVLFLTENTFLSLYIFSISHITY